MTAKSDAEKALDEREKELERREQALAAREQDLAPAAAADEDLTPTPTQAENDAARLGMGAAGSYQTRQAKNR